MFQKKSAAAMRMISVMVLLTAQSVSRALEQQQNGAEFEQHRARPAEENNYWRSDRLVATEARVLNFVEFFVEADLPALLTAFAIIAATAALAFSFPTLVAWWLSVIGVAERPSRGSAMLVFVLITAFGLAIALSVFDLDKMSLALNLNLFGIALSSGFGLQLSNLFSGLLSPMTSRVEVGEQIIINDVRGQVVEVGFFNTFIKVELRSPEDPSIVIGHTIDEVPNHYFSQYVCKRIYVNPPPAEETSISTESGAYFGSNTTSSSSTNSNKKLS